MGEERESTGVKAEEGWNIRWEADLETPS